MKFFKHFVDGHESYSMTELIDRLGVEGYGAYFILMELAIAKIDKKKDEEFSEDHCRFRIHGNVLRQKLHMRATRLELFLNSSATLGLLDWTRVEDEFNFYIPKILESLDRDSKRARTVRATPALKKKKENKKKNKNIDAHEFEMAKAFERYPIKVKGKDALKRFATQVIEQNRQSDFDLCLTNYLLMLAHETWRSPKQSWETFLGADEFWRAFREWKPLAKPDPRAVVRAPIGPPPSAPIKIDACVGPLTDDGPRTLTFNEILALRKNPAQAGKQGAS